jgi:hypothetical protein
MTVMLAESRAALDVRGVEEQECAVLGSFRIEAWQI